MFCIFGCICGKLLVLPDACSYDKVAEMKESTYIAIDLKSFYASVECANLKLDPMTTNLVVADESRTTKTICLAVSPSLRAMGIPGRARLFEVNRKVKEINASRRLHAPGGVFTGKSCDAKELEKDPSLELDFLIAPPRMAHYIEISTQIYNIYLKYLAPEDMHVYSIDEVFMDVTSYLGIYQMEPEKLAMRMILDVLSETGITATAGIGTNLYLCKVAMDIVAKHIPPDENGVRIAKLDEVTYRRTLWTHKPITDFWRVGSGIAKKLASYQIYTMGDIARCSIGAADSFYNEELLYRLFGVNAELLIDHAWGYEPCTMKEIHDYKPEKNSFGCAQIMHSPTEPEKARIIVREMTEQVALGLLEKKLVSPCFYLHIGYDIENLKEGSGRHYTGEVTIDRYGRAVPKYAHGMARLERMTSSAAEWTAAVLKTFDEVSDPELLIRRIGISALDVIPQEEYQSQPKQMSLFQDFGLQEKPEEPDAKQKEKQKEKQKKMQEAMLSIKQKYGKNAVLKGRDLTEDSTTLERNAMIGGHKA